MALATTRDKRGNAGNKMTRLLENEDDDDFYKTTYGGFMEDDDDNDYKSENSESDAIDSDFSIDENDELKSDQDDDAAPKRSRGVVTRAYKEPKKDATQKPRPKKEKKKHEVSSVQIYHSDSERKSVRRSTTEKSRALMERVKIREARAQVMKQMAAKKNVPEVRRLTQEELLAEAKITAKMNLRSLERYNRLELEKKKARVQKQHYRGPIIRHQSVTMPLIEELPTEAEINVDGEPNGDSYMDSDVQKKSNLKPTEKCARTFITFTDEKVFKTYFTRKKVRAPIRHYCPVTRLPAKYFDPITQTPYANAQAFKLIREAYYQQVDSQGNKKTDNNGKALKLQQPLLQQAKT